MPTQRQVKLPWNFFRPCICGKPPKAYSTDGTHYHLECHPCQITTPQTNRSSGRQLSLPLLS